MATSQLSEVIQHLRRAVLLRDGAGMTDGQLLEDYLRHRDEVALAALVCRHGPMVWGVCRRVLQHHDAEDTFQATFLVLVRKAASVEPKEMVANWLYGVAHQTALKARATLGKRRTRERQVTEMPERAVPEPDLWDELQPLLDQELSHLPDKYRVAIVLCDLEGKTRKEAARQLGVPAGTLAARLARGRVLLAKRIARRGPAVSGGALAALLAQKAAAGCAPTSLVNSTIKAAGVFAAWQVGGAGGISVRVAALTEGVLKAMFIPRLKLVVGLVLLMSLLLSGGAVTYHALGAGPADTKKLPAGSAGRKPDEPAEKVGEVRRFEGHGAGILRVAFSPDGRRAASSSMGNTIRLWDVATGKLVHALEGHSDRVDCVTFSPDGKRLLSGSWDGTVRLWDVESGKELKKFDSEGAPGLHVCHAIFFKDGKKFLWNAVDHHSLQIWDSEAGKQVKEFAEHPDHVAAVALSPDGKRVLEGNWDSQLRLWDIETGKELRQFQGHTGAVYCVAISPDGKSALSVSVADKEVFLWDLETGKEVRRFQGHTEGLDFVAFSPDGRRALSCGQDKTLRLWDVRTGKELHCFEGHTERVGSVAFSPDGRHALSGGEDKTVRLWRLPR
jgi:RNA polymerase sigma factor (sigma-70 family)